jgi:hypothetical protein
MIRKLSAILLNRQNINLFIIIINKSGTVVNSTTSALFGPQATFNIYLYVANSEEMYMIQPHNYLARLQPPLSLNT